MDTYLFEMGSKNTWFMVGNSLGQPIFFKMPKIPLDINSRILLFVQCYFFVCKIFITQCDFIIHYNRIVFRLYIVGVKKHKTTQFYYILYSRIMFLLLYLGQTFFHYKSIFVIIIKGCKKIKTKTQFRY